MNNPNYDSCIVINLTFVIIVIMHPTCYIQLIEYRSNIASGVHYDYYNEHEVDYIMLHPSYCKLKNIIGIQ